MSIINCGIGEAHSAGAAARFADEVSPASRAAPNMPELGRRFEK
jgi:hypothetical protein